MFSKLSQNKPPEQVLIRVFNIFSANSPKHFGQFDADALGMEKKRNFCWLK